MGLFELACLGGSSVCKRSTFMAEQLAFKEFIGNGRAVHLNKGAGATPTQLMQSTPRYLFPGTASPCDQHRHFRQSSLCKLLVDLANCSRFPLECRAAPKTFTH